MRMINQVLLAGFIILASVLILGVVSCNAIEKYEQTELSFFIEDFSGETVIGEGGNRVLKSGEFKKLIFEGTEIEVLSNIIRDDGLISTKDFGKIKISIEGWGKAQIYLKPSQERKFRKLKEKDFSELKIEDKGHLKITTYNVKSKFVENAKSGKIFVVTGKAKNGYGGPRGFIKISGKLYTKGKKLSKTETIYCGNLLSSQELSQSDVAAVKNRLLNPAVIKINSGGSAPFMIVFLNLPVALDEFTIEVEESKPIIE